MDRNVIDLEKAKKLLDSACATCAFAKNDESFFSLERGVAPLLKLLQEEKSLVGFSAADKVVGKAAAFLYVLLKVERLYAAVISKYALVVLEFYGVPVEYGELVDAIKNRKGDGFCPMETAVLEINEPDEAVAAVLKKQEELKGYVERSL